MIGSKRATSTLSNAEIRLNSIQIDNKEAPGVECISPTLGTERLSEKGISKIQPHRKALCGNVHGVFALGLSRDYGEHIHDNDFSVAVDNTDQVQVEGELEDLAWKKGVEDFNDLVL